MSMSVVEKSYELAKEQYAALGVDTEAALKRMETEAISIHAWQGDDVVGFEPQSHSLTGGCQVTGNYPGRARTPDELRMDLDKAMSLLSGNLRVNLQAHEVDKMFPGQDRDTLTIENYAGWLAWAKERKIGLDLAPAYYSHEKLDHGLSLSHPDPAIRKFWIDHGRSCRRVGAQFGRELGTPCLCNVWAPDGFKDIPADRLAPRQRLLESLDATFEETFPETEILDAVESKLFGIGAESYTVGSHDFYLTYAAKHNKLICLDSGHFHPTESIGDKISAICSQQGRILLHVSRGVRWDSDHVILLNDELLSIGRETVRGAGPNQVYIALDYFDASINRVGAWVIGTRNMQKSLLIALLEPVKLACAEENAWDFTARMSAMEAAKALPWGAVWQYFCEKHQIPQDFDVMKEIHQYEKDVQFKRN